MQPTDLISVLDTLGHPRALVLGDLILDRYTWGNAERISQEAPVLLLRADRRENRLGGAANVCQMLRGLEAEVTCAGVVGTDDAARTVRDMLAEVGVRCDMLLTDAPRPTTVKERFIGRAANRHPHQILRVDSETREPLRAELEAELARRVLAEIDRYDIVVISDYAKGVCTPALLRQVIDAAKRADVPVVVDPVRTDDYSRYRGATTMTPNRNEAECATGLKIERPEDAFEVGRRLCQQADLAMAIVTLDSDGMALVRSGAAGEVFPTKPRAIYDITGAGDMVLATIAVALAANVSPEDAVRLANVAGGLEVEHVGAVAIRRDDMRAYLVAEQMPSAAKCIAADALVRHVDAARARGQRIVFTNGCFDLLHVGHVTYLQQAATLGDVLIIGVNSDRSVRELKGPKRPVIEEHDRAALLAALSCVDYVTIFDEATPESLVRRLKPDVLAKGGDYTVAEVVGGDFVRAQGGRVVIIPLVPGVSTTKILNSAAA
ncbi:MAG: D-glycero-beta-D-manno-heptose 1-phosphate adenylyltransferase [Gemmataceae bacterium]|nr:D-glycero-beta-D-manno-heptose 1-phosphate adenylyltransferase [Gemmataceae bacterium]